jgi:hypothetical protein
MADKVEKIIYYYYYYYYYSAAHYSSVTVVFVFFQNVLYCLFIYWPNHFCSYVLWSFE